MIAGKQRKRLQDLLLRSAEISADDLAGIERVNAIVKEYTIVLRKLHEKEPNVFVKFYRHDLKEIKKQIQLTLEEPMKAEQLEKLAITRELLERSIDSAITYLTDYASI
jgi:hypothetical protein